MTALGKTLAASTLAVGLAVFVSGSASATSSYGDWDNKDNKDHKRDYGDKKLDKHKFYKLSYDERKSLCSDDKKWSGWSWYYGERDELCDNFWDKHYDNDKKDYSKYDDKKDYGKYDNKNYGWKDNDDDYFAKDYSKDESYRDTYSKKDSDHEKKAYYVTASTSDSDKYAKDNYSKDYDYDNGYKDNKYGNYGKHDGWKDKGYDSYDKSSDSKVAYRNDASDYTAQGYSEKDTTNYVKADVAQDIRVDNNVRVYGDNNTVYNTINVANYASVDQKATSNEVDYNAVSYNKSSDSGYAKDYDREYGHDGWKNGSDSSYGGSEYGKSSSDVSYAAAEYSEKSSSSEVKKETSYNLDESYKQVERDDDDYDHKKSYSGNHYDNDDCDDEDDHKKWSDERY